MTVAIEPAYLRNEAEGVFRAFFREDPPARILDAYVKAHEFCFDADDVSALLRFRDWFRAAQKQEVDLEALEFAMRLGDSNNLFTAKVRMLLYLLEADGSFFNHFHNDQKTTLVAYLELLSRISRSLWKGAKGFFLVRRYRLV